MLWQKENGIYKNFPDNVISRLEQQGRLEKNHSLDYPRPSGKNNKESSHCLEDANRALKMGKFIVAIYYCNRSLSLAENESENIGLAFATRSECFFQMKWYNKCLIDIDLAVNAGYPQNLMSNLESSKAKCLKLIEEADLSEMIEPKLDFEPNKQLPSMADVLKIEYSDEFGRMITAQCDIPAGKVVLVEKPVMTIHNCNKIELCNTCGKMNTNLVPCENCTHALFCKDMCKQEERFHQMECRIRMVDEEYHDMDIIRSILFAIDLFPNVAVLVEFVEQSVGTSSQRHIPVHLLDSHAKYQAFLQLWYLERAADDFEFARKMYFIFRALMNQTNIKQAFYSLELHRFLLHLVGHHMSIIRSNTSVIGESWFGLYFYGDYYEMPTIIASYMNHSCAPNVKIVNFNNIKLCVTIRPIKKGDQLFSSYFHENDSFFNYNQFQSIYDFKCKCEHCLQLPPAIEIKRITEDVRYSRVLQYQKITDGFINDHGLSYPMFRLWTYFYCNEEQKEALLRECVELLNEYGGSKWTDEIQIVADEYIKMLKQKSYLIDSPPNVFYSYFNVMSNE